MGAYQSVNSVWGGAMTREAIVQRSSSGTTGKPVGLARAGASWKSRYLGIAAISDTACALLAGMVAFEIRYHARIEPPTEYLAITAVLPVIWPVSVLLAGGYDSRWVGTGAEEFRRIVHAGVALTACVAVLSYSAKLDLARGYVVTALVCLTAFDLLSRYALRKRLYWHRRLGDCMQRTVVVGPPAAVAGLIDLLNCDSSHGLWVVGACLAGRADRSQDKIDGVPVIGGLDSVAAAVSSFRADTVAVVNCAEMDHTRLRELAWALEKTGTDLCVGPALLDIAGPRTTILPVAGLPLIHLEHAKLTGPKRIIKGIFDRVMALTALVLLSPLLVAVACAVRFCDGGPILFRQVRIGKDGRPFSLYKFRTMEVGAEARKVELERLNEVNGVLFKIRKDPRLTPIGGWLRCWSVDEIPQLLNVVRGEMSLVGPRPWAALPYEKAAKSRDYVPRRLAVKPGITGLWQVSGRASLPWEESVRLDLRYVEHWSLALDVQILFKTCRAVLSRTGAY
jgi:exopolysaccharide biosynthesis polyprenyl glycosylphosphotransferase